MAFLNRDRSIPDTLEVGNWVRLRTLVSLRWMAIVGQIAAVAVAMQWLGLDLRLDLCATAIGASVGFNLWAMAIYPVSKRLDETSIFFTLIFDISQLAVLLFLTGGLANPFSLLVLAPVTISATALSLRATIGIGSVAILAISGLAFANLPLHRVDGSAIGFPALLNAGMWTSLVVGVIFFAGYTRRVTEDSRSMSRALTATQLALAREQRLTALGGVVAAAAHEMGTPLATIKLVTSELSEELQDHPELLEDLSLIRSQTERCREILKDMGRSGRDDALLRHAPVVAVLQEAAEPHLDRGIDVRFLINGEEDDFEAMDQPLIQRRPEIIHGIRNLVQNAVDFARHTVWIDLSWSASELTLNIGDDGPGFPAELQGRLGDPFVSRRKKHRKKDPSRPHYEGMGLGLFIAKTLLERTGAELSFTNGSPRAASADPDARRPTGARVNVTWQRTSLEIASDPTRQPLGRNELNAP